MTDLQKTLRDISRAYLKLAMPAYFKEQERKLEVLRLLREGKVTFNVKDKP